MPEHTLTQRLVVKGYLRPDGSYYLSVPKAIQKMLDLKGAEYFLIKPKLEKREIKFKLLDFDQE